MTNLRNLYPAKRHLGYEQMGVRHTSPPTIGRKSERDDVAIAGVFPRQGREVQEAGWPPVIDERDQGKLGLSTGRTAEIEHITVDVDDRQVNDVVKMQEHLERPIGVPEVNAHREVRPIQTELGAGSPSWYLPRIRRFSILKNPSAVRHRIFGLMPPAELNHVGNPQP